MVLKEEQAKLFYGLWIPLLDYVNRKYQLFPKLYGMDTPEGLPMEEVNHISSRLWDDTKIIDDYLASERYTGMEENAEILHSEGHLFIMARDAFQYAAASHCYSYLDSVSGCHYI